MSEQRETGVDDRERVAETFSDGAVDRLSARIAEIHEFLGRAYRERAEFERAGGRPAPDGASPGMGSWCQPGDPLAPLGPPPRADGFAVGLCDAYCERGRARLAREEYHLAVSDFGAGLCLHPAASRKDLSGELWDGHAEAKEHLRGAFPTPEGAGCGPPPEDQAPPWMARNIPAGHLVVGEDVIFARFPPTPEGRRAAIDHADRLAGDPLSRSAVFNLYLTYTDDFDVHVYAFDGTRLRLDHLARTPEDGVAGDVDGTIAGT